MKSLARALLTFGVVAGLYSGTSGSAHAFWQTPPTVGSGLGVHIKSSLAQDEDLTRMRDAGFSFVRFSLGWSGVEQSKGLYDWQEADDLIGRVRRHGLKMVIPLLGGNALYDGVMQAPQPNTDKVKTRPVAPHSPESIQAYARFVAQAVLRYGTADVVWEIWNEPDLARFWPPRADGEAYATLASVTCKTVRSVAPDALLVGPGLGRVPDARDGVTPTFLNTLLSSEAAHCLNAISVHPYRHGREEPEAVFADYATLFGLMAVHRVYVPLINTEWGYTTTQVTEDDQAAYALRARLTDMIWGIPLSVWYEWRDSRHDPKDPEGHFGLMTLNGEAKPAFKEAKALWSQLRDFTLVRQIQLANPRDMVVLLRRSDGTEALVGWSLRRHSQVRLAITQDGEQEDRLLTLHPELLALGRALGAYVKGEEGAGDGA